MPDQKTIGQIVDEVADQYFASGMDAYTAGVRACLDVAKCQIELFQSIPKMLERFAEGLVKPDD